MDYAEDGEMVDVDIIKTFGDLVVADILNTDPIKATSDTPMVEIVRIFRDHNLAGIPIVDRNILKGMAMKLDLLELYFIPHHEIDDMEKLLRLASLIDPSRSVKEFMDPQPIAITPTVKAYRLAQRMLKNDIFIFPVIEEKKRDSPKAKREFIGTVTLDDMIPLLYGAIVKED